MANKTINLNPDSIRKHIKGLERLRYFLMGMTHNAEFTHELDFIKQSIEALSETKIDLHELIKALETVE